jgi:deoxyadenosine/deoxycytidine kinase
LWAFHLQVYFLGHRARTYQEAAARPEGAVIDGSIDADRNVFANSLHRQGSLSIRDLTCYDSVHRLVTAELPTPHLIIHVRAPASVLRARIQQRGQAFDRNLPLSYLAEIDEMFSSWMDTVTAAPVLTVDSSTVDFTAPHQDVGLQTLFGTVERMLQ